MGPGLDRRALIPTGVVWVAVFQDPDGVHWVDLATADLDPDQCRRKARCRYHPKTYGLVSVLCLDITYRDEIIIS